ncbi:hypothetical protein MKK88_33630 [Methylobacterium sp. E-005]|uniref:hypothetical protein n=1 Tax=Methylobacterium sp. E-005 TaxID=2836549 RepID=UPI001FBAB720|nr:hypothetical protein [Methylobacterium sp. E-005]MCJ2090888.1 hypothetical protein [Methylobacterium sp. E-005]
MLFPTLTLRRCLLVGLLLACLVKLADGVARYELRQAAGAVTLTAAALIAEPAGLSDK